jgi:transposase
VDETGTHISMTRSNAWSRCGTRAISSIPHAGRNKALTVAGAVALDGVRCLMAYEGGTTRDAFLEFVHRALVPTLNPNDVVVMDNLSAHHTDGVAQAIEAAGAHVLYLPPYHPELNPIEHTWSKLKSILRKIGARTISALASALNTAKDFVSNKDLLGWFKHCGYESQCN